MGWGVAASFLSLHLWEGRPRPKGCVRPPLSPGPLGTLGFFLFCYQAWGRGRPHWLLRGLLPHTLFSLQFHRGLCISASHKY